MALFVPLGIPAFDGTEEKGKIRFSQTIRNGNADKALIQIRNGAETFYEKEITDPNLLTEGTHMHYWDGFDEDGILDTAFLTNARSLNILSKVWYNGESSFKTTPFKIEYEEVNWVDVKINKNTKRIDVTLRVNLKDGGEIGTENNYKFEKISPGDYHNPNLKPPKKIYPWDKIPEKDLIAGKPPLKTPTKNFKNLEKLALEGLNYHWGRNKNHFVAKNVDINEELYEVFVNAINTTENAMDDVSLIFNTNNSWMRSGNPGTVEDPISFFGNIFSREAICYNVGYINHSYGWEFQSSFKENIAFKETSAHEIGHTILKAYGGTFYSYGHKGSVNTVTQSENSNATNYPVNGEIDLMKYFKNWIPYNQRNKMIATEDDVLSLIWLTKIELK